MACFFRSLISPSTSLFWGFFLSIVYIFTMPKISLDWGPIQPFLNIDNNFGNICFLKRNMKLFLAQNLGHNSLTKYQISCFVGFNQWETGVYSGPLFVLFKTLLGALTYSAVEVARNFIFWGAQHRMVNVQRFTPIASSKAAVFSKLHLTRKPRMRGQRRHLETKNSQDSSQELSKWHQKSLELRMNFRNCQELWPSSNLQHLPLNQSLVSKKTRSFWVHKLNSSYQSLKGNDICI